MSTPSYKLHVRLQQRLGALDRVLGALTHRGFLPTQFLAETDNETDSVLVTAVFACDDEKIVEKLSRWLDKQVQVLSVSVEVSGSDSHQFATPPHLASTILSS